MIRLRNFFQKAQIPYYLSWILAINYIGLELAIVTFSGARPIEVSNLGNLCCSGTCSLHSTGPGRSPTEHVALVMLAQHMEFLKGDLCFNGHWQRPLTLQIKPNPAKSVPTNVCMMKHQSWIWAQTGPQQGQAIIKRSIVNVINMFKIKRLLCIPRSLWFKNASRKLFSNFSPNFDRVLLKVASPPNYQEHLKIQHYFQFGQQYGF